LTISGYISRASGSIDVATRVVESIAELFWLLAQYVYLGRARDEDLRPGLRSFPAGDYLIVYRISKEGVVLILHIVQGRRDLGLVRPLARRNHMNFLRLNAVTSARSKSNHSPFLRFESNLLCQ
jgi:toxin ParE1/3/4